MRSWGAEYGKEKLSFLDVAEFMGKKLKRGDLYLWEDGDPITMMTISGRSDNGARISSVFTPPRHRGLGYASSAIATMSQSLLECGHGFVILTWRIGDPAGRIYERLGFRRVGIQKSYVNRKQDS
ncbi:MAG: GNAT family N-acetyltransferase [Gammaproteobacteria bacterium]|nr:GNAT family N-acetyltransferase [Gammaproteobacteria bacterium]